MTIDELKKRVREILDKADADLRARRKAKLCVHLDTAGQFTCDEPPLGETSRYFFGDDHCEQHARQTELDMLAEDQADDAAGQRLP